MNETSAGSAGADDRAGSPRGGPGEQSPLQTRAAFFKNWSWELVIGLNRAACARGSAQHGPNPQIGDTCQRRWEEARLTELSLLEVLDFLREQHKAAPFLFLTETLLLILAGGCVMPFLGIFPPPAGVNFPQPWRIKSRGFWTGNP